MSMNGGNPKDPLQTIIPDYQRELFNRFSKAATGFALEDAMGAAINVLINAIRQAYPLRAGAEARFDELMGKHKQLLMDHYDANGRRKQGVFPFHQTITPALLIDEDKIRGPQKH